jgi:hydrogenase maturation protease
MTVRPSILIAGIGNIFLGDDAFGSEVARALAQRSWPECVRVVDFGIRGIDLAYALLEEHDTVILVDAAPRGGQPGTVYVIEPDLAELSSPTPSPPIDAHTMNPLAVLRMAQSLGAEFRKLLLVGCEPLDLGGEEGSMGLSQPVTAAIPQSIGIIETLVSKIFAESQSTRNISLHTSS